MKLNDFMSNFKSISKDTSDDVYDAVVTIVWDRDEKRDDDMFPNYSVFCDKLFECVEFKEVNEYDVWIIRWSKLIKDNLELFREWSLANWRDEFEDMIKDEDPDEFICAWLDQLHAYLSGAGTETEYHNLTVLLEKCKI